jgi:hypothetical protein
VDEQARRRIADDGVRQVTRERLDEARALVSSPDFSYAARYAEIGNAATTST